MLIESLMSNKHKSKNLRKICVLWAPRVNLADRKEVQKVFEILANLMPTLSGLKVFM